MRLSHASNRVAAVALILALTTLCPGQSGRRPSQGETVKKTDPTPTEVQNKDQTDQAIKLEATLVSVPVIASDRDGRYIADLRQEDFTLQEDGVKQEIVFFATINEPFHVVLMLDTSASTQEKLGQIRRAALTFIDQLKPADRVKVISFDDQVRDLCEFTNDRAELGRAVDQTNPGQGTKLYDAVALALQKMRPIQGRKAIVLFTDGVDMYSDRARYEDNTSGVEESGVIVYPIRYDTRADIEAMLRNQGPLGGIIKTSPTGTTPTTVPGGRVPQLPPIGPSSGDVRIPPVGSPPMGSPYPRTTPYPGGRPQDNRMPDNRMPDNRMPDNRMPDNRMPDNRYPRDNRFPDDTRTDPRNSPGRVDPRTVELDAQYRLADQYLNEMAAKSGGKLTRADTLLSLPAAFAQIAAELRTQYALGYYPSNTAKDGKYRKLQVQTKRKNVLIRARPGYRASG